MDHPGKRKQTRFSEKLGVRDGGRREGKRGKVGRKRGEGDEERVCSIRGEDKEREKTKSYLD